MTWRQPQLFALLALVVALGVALVYAARQRRAALREFAEDALAARLARGVSERRRLVRRVLRVAALTVLVIALAGPKWGFHWEEVRREGIDLIVAIDTSRSMLATDVVPNRLERAKLAVLDLLPRLQGDRIGLVAYAGTAFLEAPLTLDYAAFARSLRALQVGIIPRGGTSLSRAIEVSLDAFEARQGKYEALILISDGEDHEGDALEWAKRAAERGVKIYTVGIGTPEGELVPAGGAAGGYVKDRKGQVVKSRLNEELLKDIALETGGAYVRGLGPQLGLDEVFDQHIARMERREVDSGLQRRAEERFQLPLWIAIVLLFAESAVGDRTRPPLPARGRAWMDRLARRRRRRDGRVDGARAALLAFAVLLPAGAARAGLLDREPHPVNRGVEHFEKGEYEEAVSRFGEALVEAPASPLLQFDLAAALYKQGRYDEAIAALDKVAAEGGAEWSAGANYNLGNAHFRAGAAVEETEPQQALERWSQALLAYRRAMAADPGMEDAKFNHELVQHRIDELRRRLEEEAQQQDQQEQQEDGEQEPQDDQAQEPPPESEEQPGEEEQEQREPEGGDENQDGEEPPQEQPPPPGEDGEQEPQPQPDEGEQQAPEEQEQPAEEEQAEGGEQQQGEPGGEEQPPTDAAAGGGVGEAGEEQRAAEQAAQAVLDLARDEELGPQEIERRIDAAGIGEPVSDW